MTKRIIVGISGASGQIYGLRLLKALNGLAEIHLVISDVSKQIINHELGWDLNTNSLEYYFETNFNVKLNIKQYSTKNFFAAIASGSFKSDGMIISPCSMKTLSGISNGSSANLMERAADVCLKERRKLVLLTRETPLNRIHIQNMLTATDAGATIMPASPGFYNNESSINEHIDFVVGRVLDQFDIDHKLFKQWGKK
jgi:4-hydroxy-3-polyprenylbenzoate decarboxylase